MTRGKNHYPQWICDSCGTTYGRWYQSGSYTGPPKHCATYHQGDCEVCGATKVPVTEPRDFGGLSITKIPRS